MPYQVQVSGYSLQDHQWICSLIFTGPGYYASARLLCSSTSNHFVVPCSRNPESLSPGGKVTVRLRASVLRTMPGIMKRLSSAIICGKSLQSPHPGRASRVINNTPSITYVQRREKAEQAKRTT
ncbi:hypothetical protein Z043_113875, partial [Scleropages formosus]